MSKENDTAVYDEVKVENIHFNHVVDAETLSLFPMNMKYVDDICSNFTLRVTRYLYTQSMSREEVVDAVKISIRDMKNGKGLFFIIRSNTTGEFLGCAGLRVRNTVVTPRLWIKESVWRRGHGSQTFSALQHIGQGKYPDKSYYVTLDKRNEVAKRILLKHGFIRQPHMNPRRNASYEWVILHTYTFPQ